MPRQLWNGKEIPENRQWVIPLWIILCFAAPMSLFFLGLAWYLHS